MTDIFKGKSVAFVGGSPILEGSGLGREIDSFDIVYRTNCLPANTKDYGGRCDVVSILSHHISDSNALNVPNIILFEDLDIENKKYVITEQERAFIRKMCLANFDLDIIDATAGMIAYYLSDKFGCSFFKFFGITGYQNLKGEIVNHTETKHYTEEVYTILKDWEFAKTCDMRNYECHNFKNQNDIFRALLKNKSIFMDQYSLKYFNHDGI